MCLSYAPNQLLNLFFTIQVRRNVTISDPPSGSWTFSRSVVSQIPWHYSGVKLLKVSPNTERKGEKGEDEGETEVEKEHKPKWKKDSLKHWVQLIGCFCLLLSVYSFQHRDRRRLSTYENHDGRDRARRACTIRIIITMKQIKAACTIDGSTWSDAIWARIFYGMNVVFNSVLYLTHFSSHHCSFIAPAKKTSVRQEPIRMK
jgi:hypothetical protein